MAKGDFSQEEAKTQAEIEADNESDFEEEE